MNEFITDVERQYELYCKIAEEHGFIDLDAKKNGFRCTTKSNEFNAGWIAFVGAVAAVRDEQQTIIDDLKTQLNNMEACYIEKKKELEDQHKKVDEVLEYLDGESANRWGLWKEKADMLDQGASNAFEEAYWMAKKALRGAND
ncbi:hypothetical protein [Acinetobacter lwoffii]|uniref:hypothetical protein n=1 Tax=Acinetobacter lwoffii TaxID=28090 RepID=UPI001D18C227|nr:hypothetical protein [Acinetobacter lwoffii]